MGARHWTPEEHAIVDEFYPLYGADSTARILARRGFKRPVKGVYEKAQKRMLARWYGDKRVPLCWAAPVKRGDTYNAIVKRAESDGVLRKTPGKPKYWVPTWWADKLAEEGYTPQTFGRTQRHVLKVLRQRGESMTRTVAAEVDRTVSDTAGVLRRLEARGVVKRRPAHARHANPPTVWRLA